MGWLLTVEGDEFVVVAAAGGSSAASRVGTRVPIEGAAGLALASAQPAALQIQPGDNVNDGAAGIDGTPGSVLAIPCEDDAVVGVLELANAVGGQAFTFDDVEVAQLLGRVAGTALADSTVAADSPPTPEEIATSLRHLANLEPGRYSAVARMIQSVLGES